MELSQMTSEFITKANFGQLPIYHKSLPYCHHTQSRAALISSQMWGGFITKTKFRHRICCHNWLQRHHKIHIPAGLISSRILWTVITKVQLRCRTFPHKNYGRLSLKGNSGTGNFVTNAMDGCHKSETPAPEISSQMLWMVVTKVKLRHRKFRHKCYGRLSLKGISGTGNFVTNAMDVYH